MSWVDFISGSIMALGFMTMFGVGLYVGHTIGHRKGHDRGTAIQTEQIIVTMLETEEIDRHMAQEALVLEQVVDTVVMVPVDPAPIDPAALPAQVSETGGITLQMASSDKHLDLPQEHTRDFKFEELQGELVRVDKLRARWHRLWRITRKQFQQQQEGKKS
jgi:hypothetical protein